MARYNYEDQNAVRYNQPSLLPNLVITPKNSRQQLERNLQDAGNFVTEWASKQIPLAMVSYYATGKTPGGLLTAGLNKVGQYAPIASGIAALGASRFGAPIVNGLKNFSKTPVAKIAAEFPDDVAGLLWTYKN